jgi:predicted amidohydrolase
VYAAREPAVYNTAVVYGPDGEIIARRKKPYLIEFEESDFTFTYGALGEVVPVDLGFARLAILTSKDAWMPDMVDRLAAQGADVFVQPEAFSGWTIGESAAESAWSPDTLAQSAPAAVRKHAAYRYGVVPHLVGNLFDLVFDGQSIVVGDAMPGELEPAYVGREPMGGVLAVAPWVIEDPGAKDPAMSLAARRAALRQAGQELVPGGARDNAYLETVIAADIDPGSPFPEAAAGPPGALGPSAEIGAGNAPQGHPALAWSGGGPLVAAFEEGAPGQTQIHVAISDDAGKSFGAPFAVTSSASPQIMPAALVKGTNVYVCWQERDTQGARVACAMSSNGGKAFGTPVFLPSLGNGAPDAWAPSLAAADGRVFVAYVDASSGTERIVMASAAEGTTSFDAIEVGGPRAFPDPNIRNNQWSPQVAALGSEVAVGWVDFRGYGWDVYVARSSDGGATFGPPARVDDGTDAPERLHDDPSLLFVAGGGAATLAIGWSDVRLRQSPAKARVATTAAGAFSPSRILGAAPASASAWRPRLVSLGAGKLAAVWQDDRTLGSDVYLAQSNDGGASFGGEMRIDDGGEGPSYQTAPAIAGDGIGKIAIAWEDSRSGRTRIRWAAGTP